MSGDPHPRWREQPVDRIHTPGLPRRLPGARVLVEGLDESGAVGPVLLTPDDPGYAEWDRLLPPL